jgi:hypothetical protein
MIRRRRVLSLAISALAFAYAPSARADMTKAQCIEANTKGQDSRRDGNLSDAHDQFRACAASSCPGLLRDDCTRRLAELERAQPTIAFEVKDASGSDMTGVTVTMDGRPLGRLEGKALPVDIGQHTFTFAVAGETPVTRTFVLTEGEKERRETVVMGTKPAPTPEPATGEASGASTARGNPLGTERASASSGGGTQKVLGGVAAGVGVAGIAVGSVFGLMTLSEANKQRTACASATNCNSIGTATSAHSSGATDRNVSIVGFAAGGILLVTGAVLFLTAGHGSESSATTGMTLVPTVGPGGGGMVLRGEF